MCGVCVCVCVVCVWGVDGYVHVCARVRVCGMCVVCVVCVSVTVWGTHFYALSTKVLRKYCEHTDTRKPPPPTQPAGHIDTWVGDPRSCSKIFFPVAFIGMKYLHFDVPNRVVIHGDLKSKNGIANQLALGMRLQIMTSWVTVSVGKYCCLHLANSKPKVLCTWWVSN